jgi:predicted RNA binding protein YcfA (HicA-like mRNA interferase family)
MKVRDVIRMVKQDGWYEVAQRGGHRQFKHPSKLGKVKIAGHPSADMNQGTYNNIFKSAGLKNEGICSNF